MVTTARKALRARFPHGFPAGCADGAVARPVNAKPAVCGPGPILRILLDSPPRRTLSAHAAPCAAARWTCCQLCLAPWRSAPAGIHRRGCGCAAVAPLWRPRCACGFRGPWPRAGPWHASPLRSYCPCYARPTGASPHVAIRTPRPRRRAVPHPRTASFRASASAAPQQPPPAILFHPRAAHGLSCKETPSFLEQHFFTQHWSPHYRRDRLA